MSFDLAKEVGSLLEKVQEVLGRAVVDAKGKGLSGPTLQLNALHQKLKQIHEGLSAAEASPTASSAHATSGQVVQAGEPAKDKGPAGWGSAFHAQPPTASAPHAQPGPSAAKKAPKPTIRRQAERPDETKKSDDPDGDVWDGLSQMND